MKKFKEHDTVVNVVPLLEINTGTIGTVIHIYPNDYYVVEFFDDNNKTIDCVTVSGFNLKEI